MAAGRARAACSKVGPQGLNNNERMALLSDPVALGRLHALVALEFPKFTDGRAYSQARLLRERYGYRGEIRAVGDVLRDQLRFMARSGFDAFELRVIATWRMRWRRSGSSVTAISPPPISHCRCIDGDGRNKRLF